MRSQGPPENADPNGTPNTDAWRPWHRVVIPDLPASDDGLAQASISLMELLVRDLMFIHGLTDSGIDRHDPRNRPFADKHDVLVGCAALIRTGRATRDEVAQIVASARAASVELTMLRRNVLRDLEPEVATAAVEREWRCEIDVEQLSAELDRGAELLTDRAIALLHSEWLLAPSLLA